MNPKDDRTDPWLRDAVSVAASVRLDDEVTLDAANTARVRYRGVNVKEAFTLRDADGRFFRAALRTCEGDAATALAYEAMEADPESPLKVTLFNAVPQRQRMLWVTQKAAELGVFAIQPVFTVRSVQADGLAHEKAHAWPGQAIKGARQCRRAIVPEVMRALPLAEALATPAWTGADLRVVIDDRAEAAAAGSVAAPTTIALVVGPEGGFNAGERELLRAAGAAMWRLGARVMRAETASIAGLAVLQHRFGDLTIAG
jgi:16S rRNA (uracil1498-N3)-methyltransferase